MKTTATLCFLTILFNVVQAQDKTEKITLEKRIELIETIDLRGNGLIVKTGKKEFNTTDLDWKISYYTPDLKPVWQVPVASTQVHKSYINPVVASPDGSYVYQLESKAGKITPFGTSYFFLTQINKDGKIRTHQITDTKEYGYMRTIFADNQYLYFLCTENGGERNTKMVPDERLILNRISHSDFSYKKIMVNLPKITESENTSFWAYTGHDNGRIFLSNKKIFDNKLIYQVLTINPEGAISKTVTLETVLDKKFIRPANHTKICPGTYMHEDIDFTINSSSSGAGIDSEIGSFGGLRIDIQNNSIYTFGLYGPKPFKSIGSVYEGYYTHKYDMEGKLLWTMQKPVSATLANSSYFKTAPIAYYVNLTLTIHPNQTLTLGTWFKNQLHACDISAKGEFVATYNCPMDHDVTIRDLRLCSSPAAKTKAIQYIASYDLKKLKNTAFQYFEEPEGDILIEYEPKALLLNLLYFKH